MPADVERQRAQALLRAEAEHRLKTSLAVVAGWASTLEDRWDQLPESRRREAVAIIRRVSEEMAHEACGLVEEARAELLVLDPEPVRLDLGAVLAVTTAAYDGVVERHTVTHDDTAGPVTALVDPAALQQILGHLVENAVKYSPAGGRVTVRALADVERGEALLEVRDEGPGVPDGVDLFAPFQRGPGVGGVPGSGLGLYIVRNLCRSMGGDVSCADNPDGPGATFRVHLPLAS